jgi:hypothetical protein
MTALIAFVAALAAIVVGAVVVNKVRGGTAHYLESWTPEPGERTLADDPAADFAVVGRTGQAKVMTFPRLRRTHAVMTDARIVIAVRALASRRHMITYVILLVGDDLPADDDLRGLGGGLTTSGYITIAARPEAMTVEVDGSKRYLRIVPEQTASAAMIEHCRLYGDDPDAFLAAVQSAS